jgi:hypothetical protein
MRCVPSGSKTGTCAPSQLACRLPEPPGGRGLGLGDLFEDLDVGQWAKLGAAQWTRQYQPEKAALDQRIDNPLGKLAALFDLVRGLLQQRREPARALHVADAAAEVQLSRSHMASRPVDISNVTATKF